MINAKKTIATLLVGCSVLGAGMPAFAADTTMPEVKDAAAITENVASIQPRAASYEITGNSVRLRTSPSLSSSTKGYLAKGDLVAVGHGEEAVYADGYYWLPVQVTTGSLKGSTGWVATTYMTEIG